MARILVIDDSGYFRSASRLALCRAGHLVSFACDGSTGEHAATDQDFDLIMIGVSLPVADGAEVLSNLRSRGVESPAIAIGSGVSAATRNRLASLGVVEVIERFIDPRAMVDAVARAVNRPVARAA